MAYLNTNSALCEFSPYVSFSSKRTPCVLGRSPSNALRADTWSCDKSMSIEESHLHPLLKNVLKVLYAKKSSHMRVKAGDSTASTLMLKIGSGVTTVDFLLLVKRKGLFVVDTDNGTTFFLHHKDLYGISTLEECVLYNLDLCETAKESIWLYVTNSIDNRKTTKDTFYGRASTAVRRFHDKHDVHDVGYVVEKLGKSPHDCYKIEKALLPFELAYEKKAEKMVASWNRISEVKAQYEGWGVYKVRIHNHDIKLGDQMWPINTSHVFEVRSRESSDKIVSILESVEQTLSMLIRVNYKDEQGKDHVVVTTSAEGNVISEELIKQVDNHVFHKIRSNGWPIDEIDDCRARMEVKICLGIQNNEHKVIQIEQEDILYIQGQPYVEVHFDGGLDELRLCVGLIPSIDEDGVLQTCISGRVIKQMVTALESDEKMAEVSSVAGNTDVASHQEDDSHMNERAPAIGQEEMSEPSGPLSGSFGHATVAAPPPSDPNLLLHAMDLGQTDEKEEESDSAPVGAASEPVGMQVEDATVRRSLRRQRPSNLPNESPEKPDLKKARNVNVSSSAHLVRDVEHDSEQDMITAGSHDEPSMSTRMPNESSLSYPQVSQSGTAGKVNYDLMRAEDLGRLDKNEWQQLADHALGLFIKQQDDGRDTNATVLSRSIDAAAVRLALNRSYWNGSTRCAWTRAIKEDNDPIFTEYMRHHDQAIDGLARHLSRRVATFTDRDVRVGQYLLLKDVIPGQQQILKPFQKGGKL